MSNIIEFGKKTENTNNTEVVYHDYEIVLHRLENEDKPIVLTDYGILINNGSFYAVGRHFGDGENKRIEFTTIVDVEQVRYARATGLHSVTPSKFDA